MKNNQVRYILDGDAQFLHLNDGTKINVTADEQIFVDLLEEIGEGNCRQVKVKAFFPKGQIYVGTVVGFGIRLYNKDALFDGRFNSDKIQ